MPVKTAPARRTVAAGKPRRRLPPRARLRAYSNQILLPLLANLRAGLRAAFFLRVDAGSWIASPGQLVAVAVVAFGLSIVLSRTLYSAPVVFDWGGLRALWLSVPLFLLMGLLASRLAPRRFNLLTVPVALLAATVTTDIATTAVFHLLRRLAPGNVYPVWMAVYWAYYIWSILIAAVVVYRTARLAFARVLLVLLPLLIVVVYDVFAPPRPLWYQLPPPEQSAAGGDSPVTEEMLYLQPRLAQRSIASLAPHRAGVADLYFVGFAPYGYEDVFRKESEVIRTLMDERFDTRDRSLLLVNNNKTLRLYPLATVSNLREALRRIGTLIDKQEDVVVLYLTSHGSKQHRLSADYWPLQLEEVDPALLRQLLDEAGIAWRVIVVSACYSGGFIEPLRGPGTLVVTAASAGNTSFGCGAESDFTYFAKALFDEQLRETYSFEQAFARAVPVIREREKAQREEFSDPQIAMGEAIRGKLAEVEQRLQAAHSARHERLAAPGDR